MDQSSAEPLAAFFDAFYRRRPVNASFVGVRDYDHLFPDYSENGIADTVSEMESLKRQLTGDSIDARLARGFLDIQIAEFRGNHFYRTNPALYTGEAIFGILASPARLKAVPDLLAQGRANIRTAPAEWSERALRECRAAILILADLQNADGARNAFEAFAAHLQSELLARPSDNYGCGAEFFDLLMSRGHMLRQSTDDFLRFAEEEFERHASAHSPLDEPIIQHLAEHQRCWDACRRAVEENDLFSWPDFPLVFTRPPDLVRDAAADLYYLSYRSPAALNAPLPHRCEVNPCGPITLKLNHVVHHAGPGHHVQNYFACRAESRVGRIAAVDCASRIAMFCGGTMAEGWACYATDLMEEIGFLTPAEELHQEHTRLRMAARAIVDIKLHRGELTFDQAVELYRTRVGMPEAAARKEAARNSMFPGTAMMYLLGTSAIHDLRRQLVPEMSLRDFHDRFLSYGSIPVAVIAEDMMTRGGSNLPALRG